ncbi:MAG: type I-B CRISPR-associated protein Cas5b [candidate division WOR-3 bacterium]|nr:type I-B CRISPR-associated protein Cas5b [candidate division WOR-3 bacterium]
MLISFELKGKFAHFRAFYSNATAISYYFPSRTVIVGLVAGILGYKRDSYYDEFSMEKLKVSLTIETPLRKIFTSVKYVRTKSADLTNIETGNFEAIERHMVPLEIVCSREDELLSYRIYLEFHNENVGKEFYNRLLEGKYEYGPYLGIHSFLAHIENPKIVEKSIVNTNEIDSPIATDCAGNLDVSSNDFIVIERMPLDFEFDGNFRKLRKSGDFLANIQAKPVRLKKTIKAIEVSLDEKNKKHILWME